MFFSNDYKLRINNSEIFDFTSYKHNNGVYYLSPINNDFEKHYLETRRKESRVLLDNEVVLLPQTKKGYVLEKEWRLRKNTTQRFQSYLAQKNINLILDVGCGNGWFTNIIAKEKQDAFVLGIDVNVTELEQAARLFNSKNIAFAYYDIFDENIQFINKFNLITLNASIQYFPIFEKLILRLKQFLTPNGEIHILDSPFYKNKEITQAKERTKEYYRSIGNEKLSEFYFHHNLKSLSDFETHYKPVTGLRKYLFSSNQSPFLWVSYKNECQINSVNKGFTKITKEYENLEKDSSLIQYKRKITRNHFLSRLDKESEILEINCGSGLDAIYFVNQGHKVLATDVATGMLQEVRLKIKKNQLDGKLTCEKLAFSEIRKFERDQFNGVFSNFGGLNCIDNNALNQVIHDLGKIIKPGGIITLVIMPKITFYEWFRIFKGDKSAFRRLRKGGVLATVEGEKVKTYYHSSRELRKLLIKDFKDIQIENIFTFGPAGSSYDFPLKRPTLFKFLNKIDNICSNSSIFRGFGDYYIVSAKRKKKD